MRAITRLSLVVVCSCALACASQTSPSPAPTELLTSATTPPSSPAQTPVLTDPMLISPSAKIGGVPIPWKNCGGPDDIISIHAASAGVWPLQRGKSIPITFVGRAARSLTSISGQFKMTFGLIPIVNRIFSEPFPVDAGPFAEQSMVFVPPEVPSGSVFGFHVQAGEDSRRSGVFCVDLIVPVR